MRSEDLIAKYMEAGQDEELKWYSSSYTEFEKDVEDGIVDVAEIPEFYEYPEDYQKWLESDFKFQRDRDDLQIDWDFVRGIMEEYTNPYGGYIYRRRAYLGYYSTLGILVPNGFIIDADETDRVSLGLRMNTWFNFNYEFQRLMHAKGLVNVKTQNVATPDLGWNAISDVPDEQWHYKPEGFNERYVIIYPKFVDKNNYWIDDLVRALIGDMYMFKISGGEYSSYQVVNTKATQIINQQRLVPRRAAAHSVYHLDSGRYLSRGQKASLMKQVGDTKVHVLPFRTGMWSYSLGYLVSEMLMMFQYAKRYGSAILYPIFPNFGFKGTMPQPIMKANWGQIREIAASYFLEKYPKLLGAKGDFGYISKYGEHYEPGGSTPHYRRKKGNINLNPGGVNK